MSINTKEARGNYVAKFIVRDDDSQDVVAEIINDLHKQGRVVSVGGVAVNAIDRNFDIASGWGTGSVSLKVKANKGNKSRLDWYKIGDTISLIVASN